jgi:hypothetical protein
VLLQKVTAHMPKNSQERSKKRSRYRPALRRDVLNHK